MQDGLAPGSADARKKFQELMSRNPQNLTRPDLARSPERPTLGRLGEIRVPTLIIVGESDIPDVHAHAGAIQTGIANCKRLIVPKAGHLVYMEKPEEFNQIVLRFLSGS